MDKYMKRSFTKLRTALAIPVSYTHLRAHET